MIWILSAHAVPLDIDVHAHGEVGQSDSAQSGGGAGGRLGFVLNPRLNLEGAVDLGINGATEPVVDVQPDLRFYVVPPNETGALSIVAGGGVTVGAGGLRPLGLVGAALDVPTGGGGRASAGPSLRFQGAYQVRERADVGAFQLAVGVLWGGRTVERITRVEPEPEPDPEPDPEPEPDPDPQPVRVVEQGEPETITVAAAVHHDDPSTPPPEFEEEPMVWAPHPVCEWVPASEAPKVIELNELPAGQPVHVSAPGFIPAEVVLEPGETKIELEPAPEHGSVIVVAYPRDEVKIGDEVIQTGEDGIAVVTRPEGPVDIKVRGGGRNEELLAAVAVGHAVWVRVPPPRTQIVRFKVGSSQLDNAAISAIESMVAHAGDYRFKLRGSSSPEGDEEANRRLATKRGDICKQVLIDKGIPEERIELLEGVIGMTGGNVADLRSCIVEPTEEKNDKETHRLIKAPSVPTIGGNDAEEDGE